MSICALKHTIYIYKEHNNKYDSCLVYNSRMACGWCLENCHFRLSYWSKDALLINVEERNQMRSNRARDTIRLFFKWPEHSLQVCSAVLHRFTEASFKDWVVIFLILRIRSDLWINWFCEPDNKSTLFSISERLPDLKLPATFMPSVFDSVIQESTPPPFFNVLTDYNYITISQ